MVTLKVKVLPINRVGSTLNEIYMKVIHVFLCFLILLISKFIFSLEIGIVIYWLFVGVLIYSLLIPKYWSTPISELQNKTLVKMASMPYLLIWGFLAMVLHKLIIKI